MAEVELVEGWEGEPAQAPVELAGAEAVAQPGLAARVGGQELAAIVRAEVGPVAEDRAVKEPAELGEVAVSAALAA